MDKKEQKRLADRKYYQKRKANGYLDKSANRMMKYRRTPKGKYKSYQNNAKNKKQEWEISYEYFCMIISSSCWYCGFDNNIGIDRGYNFIGYIPGNCIASCTDCNLIKGKRNVKDFLYKCKVISNNNL